MTEKRSVFIIVVLIALLMLLASCAQVEIPVKLQGKNKLAEWRKGVWITGTGTYTIYTNDHYFVLSFEGDSISPNYYFAASQVTYCSKGMARDQTVRFRQLPGGEPLSFKETNFLPDHTEAPMVLDTTLFDPTACVIKDGVIYDAIIEETDEFILLATCNGDKEKIYSDGRSVYMPAGGGEFYSYRIEKIN